MLSVLFWNVQKKPLLDRVARIVRAHAVDVVVLAECAQSDAELLAALNAGGLSAFSTPPRGEDRLALLRIDRDRVLGLDAAHGGPHRREGA